MNAIKYLLIASLALIPVAPVSAEIRSAVIRVDGLTCPFCAYGVEKKVREIPAVAGVTIRMRAGEVEVRYKQDAQAKLPDLRRAIVAAGFTPREISIEIEGRLTAGPEECGLFIEDTGVRFALSHPAEVSDTAARASEAE